MGLSPVVAGGVKYTTNGHYYYENAGFESEK